MTNRADVLVSHTDKSNTAEAFEIRPASYISYSWQEIIY